MQETITFDKLTAAKEHLNAAIEMTFLGLSPIAINVLADSSHRILFRLAEIGSLQSHKLFDQFIVPEHKSEFWSLFRRVSSFSKHADNDPRGEIELNLTANDLLIFLSIPLYMDLVKSITVEMRVFSAWFAAQNPHFFNLDKILGAPVLAVNFDLTRAEWMEIGRNHLKDNRKKAQLQS